MLKKQMLIVDDNDALREALKAVFEDDFELSFAASGEEALTQYRRSTPQVVLMDYRMPGLDGIETLQQLRSEAPDSRVVLMSAYDELPTVIQAMRQGATDFVGKPFDVAQIKAAINHAVAEKSQADSGAFRRSFRSPKPQPVITQAELDEMIHQTVRLACA